MWRKKMLLAQALISQFNVISYARLVLLYVFKAFVCRQCGPCLNYGKQNMKMGL